MRRIKYFFLLMVILVINKNLLAQSKILTTTIIQPPAKKEKKPETPVLEKGTTIIVGDDHDDFIVADEIDAKKIERDRVRKALLIKNGVVLQVAVNRKIESVQIQIAEAAIQGAKQIDKIKPIEFKYIGQMHLAKQSIDSNIHQLELQALLKPISFETTDAKY